MNDALSQFAVWLIGFRVFNTTLSVIELVYILIAAFGFCVHVYGIHVSWGDLTFLKTHKINGMRQRTARRNLRNHIGRLVVKAGLLTIGYFSAIAPPTIRPENALTSMIAVAVFLTVGGLLTWMGYADLRDRHILIDYQQALRDAQSILENDPAAVSKSSTMVLDSPSQRTTTTTITTTQPLSDGDKPDTVVDGMHKHEMGDNGHDDK